MAAPTVTKLSETLWSASPASVNSGSQTVAVGDVLVVDAQTGDSATKLTISQSGTATISGWTQQRVVNVAAFTWMSIWTTTVTGAGSITITLTKDVNANFIGGAFYKADAATTGGIGASNATNLASGAPTLGVTTTGLNSALLLFNGDWAAVDGASRTYDTSAATPTEQTYFRDSANWTVYGTKYADVGAIGAKTVGITAPGAQKYTIGVVEILGLTVSSVNVPSNPILTMLARRGYRRALAFQLIAVKPVVVTAVAAVVPLDPAVCVAAATLALTAQTQIPLGTAVAQSAATLALTAPTQVALAASVAQSTATLAVSAPAIVVLGASAAQSAATLAVTAVSSVVPLDPAAATSTGTLALTAPTQVPLGTAAAASSATLAVTAQTAVPLQASAALSTGALVLSAKVTLALSSAAAQSSATLSLTAPTQVPLQASAGQLSATLSLTARTTVVLGAAGAQSAATAFLTASTQVLLQSAAATSTGSLSVTAGPGVISFQPAAAVSSATLALRAQTLVPLGASTATSSASLTVSTPTQIPLGASSASSSASLTVSIAGAPTQVGTPGTPVYSAASVLNPTTLTPDTGSGYAVGDLILCFTACRAVAPTCATPAGWTKLAEYDATPVGIVHGYLFGFIADSTSVAAPSVVWSGLTTGAAGTPVAAQCAAFTGVTLTVDVAGALGGTGGSTTASGGGAAITTSVNNDLLLKLSVRSDDIANTWSAAGWTNVSGGAGAGAAMFTTSGADFAAHWAWQVKTPAGLSPALNFTISGGAITSQSSGGIQVALSPPVVSLALIDLAPAVCTSTGTLVLVQMAPRWQPHTGPRWDVDPEAQWTPSAGSDWPAGTGSRWDIDPGQDHW